MRRRFHTTIFLLVFAECIRRTSALMNYLPTYRSTDDFVFEIVEWSDITYNPSYFRIVKRINLQPLYKTVEILTSLVSKYNHTCLDKGESSDNHPSHNRFFKIPGTALTVSSGLRLCKNLGMKLLELRSKEDVSEFIANVQGDDFVSPAAAYYNTELRTYVFFSDDQPLKLFPAINLTPNGGSVQDFDYWDSYNTYYGQYLFKGAHVFLPICSIFYAI